jgi:PIN domain nuclease of toxin-antitoxin system
MKLLLDTHTFIWWDSDPIKLTPQVLEMCQDPENILMLRVSALQGKATIKPGSGRRSEDTIAVASSL